MNYKRVLNMRLGCLAGVLACLISFSGWAETFEETKAKAEQGDAGAQSKLATMYYEGQVVVQDYKEAVNWLMKSAEQGHAPAQFNLGVMYANGTGVAQDYNEAFKWFSKAAEQGEAGAQSNLGLMYRNGYGVLQDYAKAHMWFDLAAANGHELAENSRVLIAIAMTSKQIAEAKKMAREWMEEFEKRKKEE